MNTKRMRTENLEEEGASDKAATDRAFSDVLNGLFMMRVAQLSKNPRALPLLLSVGLF